MWISSIFFRKVPELICVPPSGEGNSSVHNLLILLQVKCEGHVTLRTAVSLAVPSAAQVAALILRHRRGRNKYDRHTKTKIADVSLHISAPMREFYCAFRQPSSSIAPGF